MRKVSIDNLPTIDKIIEVLPSSIEDQDKQSLKSYLNNLDEKYQEKIASELYDIDIENLNRPTFLIMIKQNIYTIIIFERKKKKYLLHFQQ